ncbi:MAG TPA: hypothetical protein VFE17_10780 [Candidatus Baltobacteraceae bacterium]|nr:hypothetical protein [Candidatus Baltobacteraceae bacterium]
MLRRSRYLLSGLALALVINMPPAQAARPLLDYHRLDAYFALYARDTNVPWKPASVRLDTYTSAPIDFSVYQTDPANVIVAGSTTRPRAIDTRRLRPVAHWVYAPPGGYRFQSNDITIPLGSREGFFVVEARRGSVGEQVWINRTRIGLLTKETPAGIALYAADLGNGTPLARMRVSFIVRGRFTDRYTDRNGLVRWTSTPRPVFALAQWGSSTSFVSFLPQAPLPATIVGVKTASAVVHAGDEVQVVGFARSRSGTHLRPSSGVVQIQLRSDRALIAQTPVRLDAAGAFSAALSVPPESRAGDYTVIASVNGATAGTAVHVDANAAGLSLLLAPQCERTCDPDRDVPVLVQAVRGSVPASGVPVAVSVIRSPHVYTGEVSQKPWGVTQWSSSTVSTGADGRAYITIPHPSDGLASTYGVRAVAGGATADTRIAVATSAIALRVQLDSDDIGSAVPARFEIQARDVAQGTPVRHLPVRVQLIHGNSVAQQQLLLDDAGEARGSFSAPPPGSNLVVVQALGTERAMDATQLQVEPQTMESQTAHASAGVSIALDHVSYSPGEIARVRASLSGANGAALISLESAAGAQLHLVNVRNGSATASIRVSNAPGILAVGAAFVRDGALQWSSVPIRVDAPGRPVAAPVLLNRPAYQPGTTASAQITGLRPGAGTLVVRLTRTLPTGSAMFDTAPDLLAIGSTLTQDSAVDGDSWHPWVDSTGQHAVIQTFARRTAPPADLTMTQADTASVYWKIDRQAGDAVQIPVPTLPGKYILSLLKVDDDGRVTAASTDLIVQ